MIHGKRETISPMTHPNASCLVFLPMLYIDAFPVPVSDRQNGKIFFIQERVEKCPPC